MDDKKPAATPVFEDAEASASDDSTLATDMLPEALSEEDAQTIAGLEAILAEQRALRAEAQLELDDARGMLAQLESGNLEFSAPESTGDAAAGSAAGSGELDIPALIETYRKLVANLEGKLAEIDADIARYEGEISSRQSTVPEDINAVPEPEGEFYLSGGSEISAGRRENDRSGQAPPPGVTNQKDQALTMSLTKYQPVKVERCYRVT